MRPQTWFFPSILALASLGAAESDVHPHAGYLKGLLQTAPAFSGDDIEMHPALHPEHDPHDLEHLVPGHSKDLHYTQEGHRPALHGAKHTRIEATFQHPTVILDHSRNVTKVECRANTRGRTEKMKVCFSSPEAMQKARDSWRDVGGAFNLVTYHRGCGDESGRKRSFFRAAQPVAPLGNKCLTVPAYQVGEKDAFQGVDVSVGTFVAPDERRRDAVKGHIGILPPPPDLPPLPGVSQEESTVDIAKNKAELESFVHTKLNLDAQDHLESNGPISFISYNGTIARRGFGKRGIAPDGTIWSWIEDAVTSWVKDLLFGEGTFASRVERAWNKIKDAINFALDLAAIPFGKPFERTYKHDFETTEFVGPLKDIGKPAEPKTIFDQIGNGWVIGDKGAGAKAECIKCGFEGKFETETQFRYDIKNGLTKGSLTVRNSAPATVEAQLGLTVEAKYTRNNIFVAEKVIQKKKIKGILVKGIFDLGLMAVAKAGITASVEGDFKFLFGGTLEMSAGSVHLDLANQGANKISGWNPKLTPTFKADEGAVTVTIEAGMPFGIEAGVTILDGAWGETVGAYITPSLYGSTTLGNKEESVCKGLEFRMGTKVRAYGAALDLWEWELLEFKFFEFGVFCWDKEGFSFEKVNKAVKLEFSGKIGELLKAAQTDDGDTSLPDDPPPPLKNQEPKPEEGTSSGTFRVLGDDADKYIVMTGTDNGIYLVDKTDPNDISAPLGTLDHQTDFLAFDVFGRIMHYANADLDESSSSVMRLRVSPPNNMPTNQTITALARLEHDQADHGAYAAPRTVGNDKNTKLDFFYPTACETERGLRLIATRDIVNKDTASIQQPPGSVLGPLLPGGPEQPPHEPWQVPAGLRHFGFDPAKCRTIQLKSEKEIIQEEEELE